MITNDLSILQHNGTYMFGKYDASFLHGYRHMRVMILQR